MILDDTGDTVTLPELDDFSPTGTGEPPLSKAVSWAKTKDHLSGKPARREPSTMPQWAGSCWYYLRFMDAKNSEELVAKTKEMQAKSFSGNSSYKILLYLQIKNSKGTGTKLMCMLVVQNMLSFIYFIQGSGPRS